MKACDTPAEAKTVIEETLKNYKVEEEQFTDNITGWKDNELRYVYPEEYDEVKKEFTKRKDLFNITVTQDFKYKINELGQEIIDDGIEIQDEATQLTHEQLKTGSWKNLHYRGYDINASAPNYFPGKVHPLQQTDNFLQFP